MARRMMSAAAVTALVLGLAGMAMADTLSSTTNLGGYGDIPLTNSGNLSANSSNVYDFNDLDGDGGTVGGETGDAVAPPGLDMLGRRLYTNDGSTHIRLSLNGGDLDGTAVTALSTYVTAYVSAPDVTITNVGNIEMGGINTRCGRNYTGYGGDITIGASNDRAGKVEVGFLYSNADHTGGDGGGDINIYGSGDVLVQDGGGTPGDIITHGYSTSLEGRWGSVKIDHDGEFLADWIDTRMIDNASRDYCGNVTLEGNALDGQPGDNPRAKCTVGNIDTFYNTTSIFAYGAGHVNISGYSEVETGRIHTWNERSNGDSPGNISIVDITGDINITGSLDLHGSGQGGNLTLRCGEQIFLASLDLSLMETVTFETGGHPVYDWVWVQSEPLNLGISGSGVTQFTSVNSHVYYTDAAGGLSGTYNIITGGSDSGWDLMPLAVGEEPPVPLPVSEPAGLGLIGLVLLRLRKRHGK
jgi:hypothetical protein